jgi:hypothetical protein
MIEGLEQVLIDTGEPGLEEVRRALPDVLRESSGSVLYTGAQRLKSRVYRLRFAAGSGARSLVLKRLTPLAAWRNEMIAWRWLPAVELKDSGPGLLGVVASARGECIWHVYEDHGDTELMGRETDTARVAAAARLIARVHSRFAAHPLLAECRPYGAFDISWFTANVRDAIRALQALRPPEAVLSAEQAALRDRLLARMTRLLDDQSHRARALAKWSGPETLLHGDLWTSNLFVRRAPEGFEARLGDWDRAGVGPMSYDLSTFLLRFPAEQREWILDIYARALENHVWRLPGRSRLNLLCETAELSRYANRIIWPALAIAREGAAWGFDELAEVERWFEALGPVLPRPARRRPARAAVAEC